MKYATVAEAYEKAYKRLTPFWTEATPWGELSQADRLLIVAAVVEVIDILYDDLEFTGL